MKFYLKLIDICFTLYNEDTLNRGSFIAHLIKYQDSEIILNISDGKEHYLAFIELIKSNDSTKFGLFKNIFYKDSNLLAQFGLFISTILTDYFIVKYFQRPESKESTIDTIFQRSNILFSMALMNLMSLNSVDYKKYISFMKAIDLYCDSYDFRILKFPIFDSFIEMYFSNSVKDSYFDKVETFREFRIYFDASYELISFVRKLALSYRTQIYQEIAVQNDIKLYYEKFSTAYNLYEFDVVSIYHLFLLRIEYNYYFNLIDQENTLFQFQAFINSNKDVIGINKYYSGINNLILNFLIIRNYDRALFLIDQFINSPVLRDKFRFNLYLIFLCHLISINDTVSFSRQVIILRLKISIERYRDLSCLFFLFQASHHHLTGQYKQCQLDLNEAAPLLNDKSGYGLGIRILEIMNFIKWEKFEQVENALLNLKNHITQLKKGGKLKPRYLYIYKILVRLHSSGYNFKDTFRLHKEKLHQMNGDLIEYAWEFRSPELLRFDLWFFDQAGFLPNWSLNDPRINK